MERDNGLFNEMRKAEPRMDALLRAARAWRSAKREVLARFPTATFCMTGIWYGYFKPHVVRLAGYEAENRSWRTEEHYDALYFTLHEALPKCTHHDPLCPGTTFTCNEPLFQD